MKFSISIFIPLYLLISCSPSTFEKQVITYVYDFTKYTNKGFLFTPDPYSGEYLSIGLLEVEIYPQTEKVQSKVKSNQYGTKDYGEASKWVYYPINTEEVLDSLYNLATKMGANAIVRLKIEDFIVSYGIINSYGKRASGFAIKRK